MNRCIDCHFFKRDVLQHPQIIPRTDRDLLITANFVLDVPEYVYGCYHMVWDRGYGVEGDTNDYLTENILQLPRDNCFFFEFQKGMLFPAAATLQKRQAEQQEASRDRKLVKYGIWVAAVAIFANVCVSIIGFSCNSSKEASSTQNNAQAERSENQTRVESHLYIKALEQSLKTLAHLGQEEADR